MRNLLYLFILAIFAMATNSCVRNHPTELAECDLIDTVCEDTVLEDTVLEDTQSKIPELNHEYVDLGLDVYWATCNVGANTPEESGDYFAWGETEPQRDYAYSMDSYKWFKKDIESRMGLRYGTTVHYLKYTGMIKYKKPSGSGDNTYADNKAVIDSIDDAATANWGNPWRMPSVRDLKQLIENCTFTWAEHNGFGGYTVTGPNGNSIFLPAAGYYKDGLLHQHQNESRYLSSHITWLNEFVRLIEQSDYNAVNLLISDSTLILYDLTDNSTKYKKERILMPTSPRSNGAPVRAVCPKGNYR